MTRIYSSVNVLLRRTSKLWMMGLLWFLGFVQPVWAIQSHGGLEGLISHEIGHILFFLGMSFILFYVVKEKYHSTAWLQFRWFLYLIMFWNILTFSGHIAHEYSTSGHTQHVDGHLVSFKINNVFDLLHYLTHLDHLVLVPAILFLLLALKQWRSEP